MTSESLKQLLEEATPGPWRTVEQQGDLIIPGPPWQGYESEWVNHADGHLIALAPDLARIVIEQHEALQSIENMSGSAGSGEVQAMPIAARARTALALLDGLGQ